MLTEREHYFDWMRLGREAESEADFQTALQFYQKAAKALPDAALPHERIMIVYRKQKAYRKELDFINKVLTSFEEKYRKRIHPKHLTPQQLRLTRRLAIALDVADKKGGALYAPQPVPRWRTRKVNLMKKMKLTK